MSATTEPLVRVTTDEGVTTLTLDSPANRNALSARLVGELCDHLDAVAENAAVRAVLLTHTGTTFCAGADLAEAASEGGPAAGTARLVGLLRQILQLPKPVVALVQGHVRAGGLGLLGACDLVIASPASSFAFTEVRLGLAPSIISLTVLPRLADRDAARLFLTGDTFDATEAARIGLVTEVADDTHDAVARVLTSLRAGSPQGLAATKWLTTRTVLAGFAADAEQLQAHSAQLFASEEAQEGIASFRERRPPRWAAP